MSYDEDDGFLFNRPGKGADEEEKFETINFLEQFSISGVSHNLSLEEQEQVANKLVDEVLRRAAAGNVKTPISSRHNKRSDLPDHLEKFRIEYERLNGPRGRPSSNSSSSSSSSSGIQLPLIRTMSPRTAKKASLLPDPTEIEQAKIDDLERLSKSMGASSFYKRKPPSSAAPIYSNTLSQMEIQNFYQGLEKKHVLVSNKVKADIGKNSTQLFENGAKYKTRKKDQDEIRAQLLDDKVW